MGERCARLGVSDSAWERERAHVVTGDDARRRQNEEDDGGTGHGMPLLQFDTTLSLSADEKTAFAERVTDLYTTEMATEAGHVAVTIREHEAAELHLGRAVEGALLFLDADVRRGRSFDRKRAFALATVEYVASTFDVPGENVKVVFTEHAGEAMMGANRVGGEWSEE